MALLTAEDVLNKAFSKTKYREGFDQDEVDDFLDEVAHTIQSLTAERDDLAQRLAQAQAGAATTPSQPSAPEPEAAQSTEGGLLAAATDPTPPSATGMLAMAQKLHDEYVQAGEEERDRLVGEAKTKAEAIVEQAETDAKARMDELVDERSELERKIDDLRRFERDYRARLKSYLENLLGDLDHGAKADAPAPAADAGGTALDSAAGATAADGGFGGDEAPSQASAPSAQDAPSQPSAGEGPQAAQSPWAQVRPQDGQEEQEEQEEKPAPWGGSSYQPTAGPPSAVAQEFSAESDDGEQR